MTRPVSARSLLQNFSPTVRLQKKRTSLSSAIAHPWPTPNAPQARRWISPQSVKPRSVVAISRNPSGLNGRVSTRPLLRVAKPKRRTENSCSTCSRWARNSRETARPTRYVLRLSTKARCVRAACIRQTSYAGLKTCSAVTPTPANSTYSTRCGRRASPPTLRSRM